MLTFIAICVGVLTVVHLIALIIWAVTAVQMRRAAQAVEVLAYRAQDQLVRLGTTTESVRDFAASLRSVWLRAFTAALEAITAIWSRRKDAEKVHTSDGG